MCERGLMGFLCVLLYISVCVCVTMSAVDSGMEEQMVRAQSFFHRHKRENGSGSKRYPQLTIQLSISEDSIARLAEGCWACTLAKTCLFLVCFIRVQSTSFIRTRWSTIYQFTTTPKTISGSLPFKVFPNIFLFRFPLNYKLELAFTIQVQILFPQSTFKEVECLICWTVSLFPVHGLLRCQGFGQRKKQPFPLSLSSKIHWRRNCPPTPPH